MSIRTIVRNPVISILLHYLAWEFFFILTYLPVILSNSTRELDIMSWDHLLYDNGLIGTINFILFALMTFLVIPFFFIKRKKWSILIILSISAAFLFTYVKYQLYINHFPVRMEKLQKLNIPNNPYSRMGTTLSPVKKTDSLLSNKTTDTSTPKKNTLPSKGSVRKILPGMPVQYSGFRGYLNTEIWYNILIILLAFGYVLLGQWILQEKIRRELENEKLKAELSFLKLQVNPHFLFNALNNIYSLSVIEKGKRTGDSIMKLSELIRYMLYEKEDESYRVSIEKEINHINSFIDLQRLRHLEDIYIQFSIEGDFTGRKIPPLLLFPLIENSCKHGILQDPARPVEIHIKIKDNKLFFYIHNFKNDYLKDHTGGIGLENVRKRLSLLFPNTHSFQITETDKEFSIEIELSL